MCIASTREQQKGLQRINKEVKLISGLKGTLRAACSRSGKLVARVTCALSLLSRLSSRGAAMLQAINSGFGPSLKEMNQY